MKVWRQIPPHVNWWGPSSHYLEEQQEREREADEGQIAVVREGWWWGLSMLRIYLIKSNQSSLPVV